MGFKSGKSDLDQLTVIGEVVLSGDTALTGSLEITAGEGAAATIIMRADEGDDANDVTTITVADGGNFTVDCAGDIELNADGGDITFKDASTTLASIDSSGNVTALGDIILDDGGSLKEAGGVAALTFDGSGNVTKIGVSTQTSGHYLKYDGSKYLLAAVSGEVAGGVAADDINQGDGQIDIKTNTGTINIGHADNDEAINIGSTGTGAIQIGHSTTTSVTVDAIAVVVDSADTINIDSADEITVDTTSADGHIAITSAHTAGQSILISANADAGAILDIDAGIIDIDVQDTINIDAADEIEIATTSADGHITLTSAHTSGVAFHIDANADAASEVQIDAGVLDIDVTAGITIDGTTLSIDGTDDSNITVTASAKDLDIAVAGGGTQELRLASAGTGASALHLNASAGSVDIDSADAITVDAADEIVITTTSADGHISLVSAHTSGVAFHLDANADAASEVQIDAGVLDIDVTAGITIDGTTLSIDGTDDSNITVTASAKDLDIAVAGGGTQELRLASAGTGASALHLNASAGSVDIDSADAITVDAADEIVITTTSADGHISLVSAHTAGVAFHLDANADADSEVQIDAGILDIDVTAAATIDAVGLALGAGSGELDLTTTGTLDINANSLDMDLTDSSAITITSSEAAEDLTIEQVGGNDSSIIIQAAGTGADAIKLNASAGSIDIDAAATKDVTINSGQVIVTAAHNVSEAIKLHADAGANQTIQIINDEGTTDGSEGAGAIDIEATVGGISLHAADDKDISIEAGQVVLTANHDAADAIKLHADAGSSQTIQIVNDAGTTDGSDDAGAIELSAAAGGIGLAWADGKDLWAEGGRAIVTANEDAADCIKLHADAGTSQTITIVNDAGTSATEGSAAIQLLASAGGINIKGNLDGANAVLLTADGGTSATIVAHNDQSTVDGTAGAGSICLLSDAGGIGLSWADGKDLWAEGGRAVITANEDAADCIKLHADAGTSQTIALLNDAGTSAAAIGLTSTAGGITMTSSATTAQDAVTVSAAQTTKNGLTLTANALTSGDAVSISSTSDDTTARSLLKLTNDDAAATGTSIIEIDQDSTGALINAAYGANGSNLALKVKEVTSAYGDDGSALLMTIDDFIPAGAVPIALAIRTTVAVNNNCALSLIGIAGNGAAPADPDHYLSAGSLPTSGGGSITAADTTLVLGIGQSPAFNTPFFTDTDLTLTFVHHSGTTNLTAGTFRIALYYYQITAPTS